MMQDDYSAQTNTCTTLPRAEKLARSEIDNLGALGSPIVSMLAKWVNKMLACSNCFKCSRRCEVLENPKLHIGEVEAEFLRIKSLSATDQVDAVISLVNERPELYFALRQCCFCGHCTAFCETHMQAPVRMREWRELFSQSGLMPENESKLVMVDNEWHIFSAYRAIYNVAYPEFFQLSELAASSCDLAGNDNQQRIDTLFFPGCSLVSYAPHLIREVGLWLDSQDIRWAMSMDCCGSPLMSAGLFERSIALRTKILEQIRTVGIKRVFTVCPGCGEELSEVFADEVEIIPLAEFLLERDFYNNRRSEIGCTAAVVDFASSVSDTQDEVSFTDDTAAKSRDAIFSSSTTGAVGDVDISGTSRFTVFDSCHDRHDGRHGTAVRDLLHKTIPNSLLYEMEHNGKNTLCCSAGGAVSAFDSDISQRRVWRVINEAKATGAQTLVTMCPTCTYTIAFAQLQAAQRASNEQAKTEDAALSEQLEQADLAIAHQSVVHGCSDVASMLSSHHYLELVFDKKINWEQTFAQLEGMWVGEYGEWARATLL